MMHFYDLAYATEEKADEPTPESAIVTEIDGKIDNIVRNYFRQVWPDDQLLTEETEADECWYKARRIWVIDPIDGTMGYKKKTGSFGISIALVEEGRPVVGVLYSPVPDLLGSAVTGRGAYLNGTIVDINGAGTVSTILASSNSINRPPYQKTLEAINIDNKFKILTMESVVAKALGILQNLGQICLNLPISGETKSAPKFWDIAAADIIIHEAGGRVSTFSGETYLYNIPDFKCSGGVLMGTRAGHRLAFERIHSM